MFEHPAIIVGLEIGTSKICAMVAEVNAEGIPNIIGVGQAASTGVRKGEISDPQQVENCVRNAIVEAEHMANVEIRSVFLGVTGSHIRGFNNKGVHPVVSVDRQITEEDVQDVVKNAKAVNLPPDGHVIHTIRQHFKVDEQDGITNPVGKSGALLGVDVHVIHGNFNRLQDSIRVVKGLQLEVEDVVFNGLAASLALLSQEQKDLGTVVIDLGGGTTNYTVLTKGIIQHTGVLAVGGDHVSNDLAIGLKVPLGRAEKLKLEHGGALMDEAIKGQVLNLASEHGLPSKTINLGHLRRIMHLRLEETLQLVAQDIDRVGLLDRLHGGVVLCGGGAHVPQINKLAEHVFGLPVTVGRAQTLSGSKSAIEQPEFATARGLVKFGALRQKRRTSSSALSSIRETLGQLFRLGA